MAEHIVFKNTDDAIMGLLAGINTLMEVLVARGLVTDQNLREMLSIAKGKFATQPDASAIIRLMMLSHRRPQVRRPLLRG